MLKIIIVSAIVVVLIIGLVTGKRIYDYMNKPILLQLTEIARLNTEKELPGTWWTVLSDDNHPYIKEYALKLPDIDYSKYNLIISAGREIKQMTYTRASIRKTPDKKSYIGKATFKNPLNQNTMFVYKINKIKLVDGEGAGFNSEIIIED